VPAAPLAQILQGRKEKRSVLDRWAITRYDGHMQYQKDLADELANDDSWIWRDDQIVWDDGDDGEDISDEAEAIMTGHVRRTFNGWNQR
jgi:hypothetical protein